MKKYSEILFMFVFCIYFYVSAADVSFVNFPLVSVINACLPVLMPVAAFLQLITHVEDKKKFVLGVIFLVALWIVSVLNGYTHLRYLGLIAAGSIGIDYRKALKCTCSISFAVILMTLLYTFAIDPSLNTVYVTNVRIRSTGGMTYPTEAAAMVLYLSMMMFAIGRSISAGMTLITGLVCLIASRYYFDANTSVICSLLFLLVIAFVLVEEYFLRKRDLKWLYGLIDVAALLVVPLLTTAVFALSMCYGKEYAWAIKIDELLHHRLRYTFKGISEEGVSLFGKYVKMVGADSPGMAKSVDYNYLDNAIVQMVICFGIVASVCIALIWICILVRSIKGRNIRILLISFIIMAHSFEAPNFFRFAFNALLFLPLASGYETDEPVPELGQLPKKLAVTFGGCVAIVLAFFLIAPGVFSATRTAVYKKGHDATHISERIEADRDAVETILSNHEKPVYADVFTTDYCKAFKGINKTIFSGEDLVREIDCTIITNPDYSYAYFERGCLYSRISDYSAIYTTDRKVAESLMQAGYHVAGFYYQNTDIAFNEKYTSGSVPVFDDKGTLKGTVRLLNDIGEGNVFMLRVDSTSGHEALLYYDIEDFDDDKSLTYDVTFSKGWGNVTVNIFALNGARLEVGTAVMEGNSIIEDQKIEYSFAGLYSDDYRIYSGKYKLHVDVTASDIDTENTDSLGTVSISHTEDEKDNKNLKFTELSEDGTYSFDFKFSSKGEVCTFEIKPDEACRIDSVSARYVLNTSSDIHYIYNSDGRVIRKEYYDLDGNMTYSKDGVFAYEYEYNKNGNKTVTRYYGQDNKLMLTKNGYAEFHSEFDKLGHVIGKSYYGCDGEPVTIAKGYASFTREVTVWGKPLVTKFFGTDGKPVITTMGYAEIHREYNDDRYMICERYYDVNGERQTLEKGYSGIRYEYDDNGNKSHIVYLDSDDNPVMTTDGYAQIHREYDDKGQIIVEYFGDEKDEILIDGKKITTTTREYDEFGNVTVIRYFEEDTSAGYVEIRKEYDSKNRVIYAGKFNSDGERVQWKNKYSYYYKTYDDAGNLIRTEYYTKKDNPAMYKNKYAVIEKDYDENGNVIAERWYDKKGNLIEH